MCATIYRVYHFLVLDLVERAVSVRASCLDLVVRHGLVQWLLTSLAAPEVSLPLHSPLVEVLLSLPLPLR